MNKYRNRIIVLILAVIILFILQVANINPLNVLVQPVLNPIEAFLFSKIQALGENIQTLKNAKALSEDISVLRSQNQELLVQVSQLKQYEVENKSLKEQLHFFEDFPQDRALIARMIGISEDNESIFYINKGTEDDVVEGLPVITNNGIIVGKIIQAERNISKAVFLTDNNSLMSATIQNENRTTQIVRGEHGLSLRMEFIPQETEIQVGDTVVTSGLEPNIPAGLLIGEILEIESAVNEPFQTAFLKTPVQYEGISLVTILKPQQ